jgi:peptide/nickel transport system permease protein
MCRIIHGQVLSLREKEFIEAARCLGIPTWRILLRHLLPHLVSPIIVYTTLGVATTVVFEASLSYLGLGVQPPTPSWGKMAGDGSAQLNYPWLVIFPGLAILLTVLGFNLLGDGLRDAFDPRQRR